MDKTFDEFQRHIWFEACPQDEGVFFDAGEFSDLKYETLWTGYDILPKVRDPQVDDCPRSYFPTLLSPSEYVAGTSGKLLARRNALTAWVLVSRIT
jgi:hypothetical protein